MALFGLTQWYRRQRRQRALKKQAELREFVYLDDISVFSLIASQLGPIATEFTNTEAASLQGEVSTELGANIGIGKAEATSRLQTERTQTTQVVRRSIIQNTFKELRDHVANTDLLLNVAAADLDRGALSDVSSIDQLVKEVPEAAVVDPAQLGRGRLIEVDVELEADPIFKVNAAMSAVLEIVQETPHLFGDATASMADARAIQKIINRLLTGLVPIRGRMVDYLVVELGSERRIARREVAEALEATHGWHVRPLYLVGVASEALFWKDVRLVLFSKARYRVMCRTAHDGVQERWTASKLVEVLSSTFPQIGTQLDEAINAALSTLDATSGDAYAADDREARMQGALLRYAQALAESRGAEISVEQLAAAGIPRPADANSFGDVAARRLAFASVAETVGTLLDVSFDHDALPSLRSAALLSAGLDLTGQAIPSDSQSHGVVRDTTEGLFLEAQFVAIYW